MTTNKRADTHDEFIAAAKERDPEKWNEIEFHSDFVSQMVIARTNKGLSQEQLASMVGMKQSAIARIEACTCVPKITTAAKILSALDMELKVQQKYYDLRVYNAEGNVIQYCMPKNKKYIQVWETQKFEPTEMRCSLVG